MDIEKIAELPLDSFKGMDLEDRINGTKQMIADLERMAITDGCIAAGFALDLMDKIAPDPVHTAFLRLFDYISDGDRPTAEPEEDQSTAHFLDSKEIESKFTKAFAEEMNSAIEQINLGLKKVMPIIRDELKKREDAIQKAFGAISSPVPFPPEENN